MRGRRVVAVFFCVLCLCWSVRVCAWCECLSVSVLVCVPKAPLPLPTHKGQVGKEGRSP